jgi:3-oxoacyl-[acyl-carrier protein] reductase
MSDSTAVVTGASQGIGRSTGIRLAQDFAAVVLVARSRAHLEDTASQVQAAGAKALVIDLDLAERSAARAVVERTLGPSAASTPWSTSPARCRRSICSR